MTSVVGPFSLLASSPLTKLDHLYSSSAGGKDLSHIRVIDLVMAEVWTKMIRYLIENLRAKLLATTLGYSMVKVARLDDAFSELIGLEVSRDVEGQ